MFSIIFKNLISVYMHIIKAYFVLFFFFLHYVIFIKFRDPKDLKEKLDLLALKVFAVKLVFVALLELKAEQVAQEN